MATATLKKFKTLVPLNYKGGNSFEIAGETELPQWFKVESLVLPKRIQVEPWLLEYMFGK